MDFSSNYPQDQFTLDAKFVRFEDRFAILYNKILGEFRWPIKNLPDSANPNDIFYIKITTQQIEEDEKYARMRRLLEELIN